MIFGSNSLLAGGAIALLSLALSAALTRYAIAYGSRRALVDAPGQRRSHAAPTPRGGGIGIAACLCVFAIGLLWPADPWQQSARLLAVLALAAVSWADDHRSLGIGVRLGVQAFSCVLLAWTLLAPATDGAEISTAIRALFYIAALLWSVNLHNFMDGINGIAALQSMFVFALLGALAAVHGDAPLALACVVPLSAALGFAPFNFPHARIFLGDVGSTVLGLWIGLVSLEGVRRGVFSLGTALIASSAFVIDASATLLTRAARGKRWWKPHREHLYQWLHRSGRSHAQVVVLYAAWNGFVALPLALLNEACIEPLALSASAAGAALYSVAAPALVLGLGLAAWGYGKKSCRTRLMERH